MIKCDGREAKLYIEISLVLVGHSSI